MTGLDMGELVLATQDYTTVSVNLAKRLTKRIESGVLPSGAQQSAVQALEVLKNGIRFLIYTYSRFVSFPPLVLILFIFSIPESANVINVKRNQLTFPGNEMHAVSLDSTVKTIVAAVKVFSYSPSLSLPLLPTSSILP